MNGRETILGRIREALRVAAPHPGGHDPAQPSSPAQPDLFDHGARDWLPPVGETFGEQVALFRQNAEALKADFADCSSPEEAASKIAALAASEGWKSVAAHRDPLLEPALAALGNIPVLVTAGGYEIPALESCDAGITTCECLVAQTGSALVSSAANGGRALSVLPPHHVILAKRDQLLPDLTAALERAEQKYASAFPSTLSFITGPSRTGDIERILVLGAHGPKKLSIFLIP